MHPPYGLPARLLIHPKSVADVICAPLLGSQNRTLHHILKTNDCIHADLHADSDAKDIELKHSDNEQGRKPRHNSLQGLRSKLYRRTESHSEDSGRLGRLQVSYTLASGATFQNNTRPGPRLARHSSQAFAS